jgi:hypothetical protein
MNKTHFRKLASEVNVPVQQLPADIITKIKEAPQAQKRTAKFKKAVYIVEDLVFKGPYGCNDLGLINNLRYTYAIELLEAALQLHERQRGSLRWKHLGRGDDNQYYLVAPNVGNRKNIPFELVTTKIETNVKVVPRGEAIKRVSDIEETEDLTDDIKLATLQHLYFRFLLGIGDSGTYNVLVRKDNDSTKRLIAGIDLEENRVIEDKEQRLALLFSKAPFKKHIALYESDICKIRSLSYDHLNQHTLDRLNAIGIHLQRLKKNLELWKK